MLPRELHLEQINRFHDKFKQIREEIQKVKDRDDLLDYKYKLTNQYFEMVELWSKIDDVCEMEIKNSIDIMES
jgi:hypothetical protein